MLLKWILKLLGLGFLLGVGTHCRRGRGEEGEVSQRARERAARRLHRLADAIANLDEEEPSATSGE